MTPDDVTSLWNATAIPVEDQDSVQAGNRSACGVIAAAGKMARPSSWGLEPPGGKGLGRGQAADGPSLCGKLLLTPTGLPPTVVLSVGVAAISLFVLSRLRAQGRLYPLGLLMVMKESLLLSERKTSLL